jgi:iron(III) transport system substrate-binding protein
MFGFARQALFLPALALCIAIAVACSDDSTPTQTPSSPTTTATAIGSATGSPTGSATATGSAVPTGDPTATATLDPNAGLTVYSGRTQDLVEPVIERFEEQTGIDVAVRYGSTAELAATILEEGDNSPADVYFAQDAGALGALAQEQRLQQLPEDVLSLVDPAYRSDAALWVGVSGRARVVAYNTSILQAEDLPPSILDFTDARWAGKLGWAPTNGSFQAFVTALRRLQGDDAARAWLEAMLENDVRTYENNVAIVQAVADGEIEAGLVNHYYLLQFLAERGESFPVRNHYTAAGDPGSLVNVAGAGVVAGTDHEDAALAFIRFMLSEEAQGYFAEETYEYPLLAGVDGPAGLTPLAELEPPALDLSDLEDLAGTLELLEETGVLP